MTLAQKFASLTPEQQEQFKAIKDSAALDAFLSENNLTLTDEEKTHALEYSKSGKLRLADEDLNSTAGGSEKVCKNCGSTNVMKFKVPTTLASYYKCMKCNTIQ